MAGEKTVKVLCVSTALWRRREKRGVRWEDGGLNNMKQNKTNTTNGVRNMTKTINLPEKCQKCESGIKTQRFISNFQENDDAK